MEQSADRTMQIIKKNSVDAIPLLELRQKVDNAIATNTPLKVKIGLDPTRPDLHLGHCIVLHKVRELQDLGHKAILIVGDFTACIGDPTGKNTTRPKLDKHEVKRNAQTYMDQACKILDFNEDKIEIIYNSSWFNKIGLDEWINVCSNMTVSRMLDRNDFSKRYAEQTPIYLHEFMYPMAQAYDSFMVEADIEIGGTDQTFNMMCGRTLMERYKMDPQCIITMPIIDGLDGRKMSKSYDNTINFNDTPDDIYGKVMSITDDQADEWIKLFLPDYIDIKGKEIFTPVIRKKSLACHIVGIFHGKEASSLAYESFEKRFVRKEIDKDNIPAFRIEDRTHTVIDIMVLSGMCPSKSEARRLVKSDAVTWITNGISEKISDPNLSFPYGVSGILKVGKRRAIHVQEHRDNTTNT